MNEVGGREVRRNGKGRKKGGRRRKKRKEKSAGDTKETLQLHGMN